MSLRRRLAKLGLFPLLIVFAFGGAFLIAGETVAELYGTASWPSVSGSVTRGGRVSTEYEYEVDGHQFAGRTNTDSNRFHRGQLVAVRYDPMNPSTSVVEKAIWSVLPRLLMGVVWVGIGLVMLVPAVRIFGAAGGAVLARHERARWRRLERQRRRRAARLAPARRQRRPAGRG
jgi:hypothetical protein